MSNIIKEPKSGWGGGWTEKKLTAFENYVKAYLTIMNSNPYWETIYFDGFAGSGERRLVEKDSNLLVQLQIPIEEESVYSGAAERISLMDEPHRFDFYYFVEKNQKSLDKLKHKIEPIHENKSGVPVFKHGDCNAVLTELANALHKTKAIKSKSLKYAALMFLDPFGMHINWSSLERFANTKSDVWILLPTAVIVNRLLLKNGDINVRKLTTFFGMKETEIRDYFYVHTGQLSAFSEEPDEVVKVTDPIGKIAKLYIARLGTIWKHVTENPLVLKTSNNRPLFHLVFASNNRSAMNIANSIISHIY